MKAEEMYGNPYQENKVNSVKNEDELMEDKVMSMSLYELHDCIETCELLEEFKKSECFLDYVGSSWFVTSKDNEVVATDEELIECLRDAHEMGLETMSTQLTFGIDTVVSVLKKQKKANPCIAVYGKYAVTDTKCKDCKHLLIHQCSKRYYKCNLRKVTAGPATDHRCNWPACGKFEEKE